MAAKITNNAWGVLTEDVTPTSTTVTLSDGDTARFPTLLTGDYAWATLSNANNQLEVVKVTSISGNSLAVERGKDGTTARAYAPGDRVELRIPAVLLNEKIDVASADAKYAPKTGATLTNVTLVGTTVAPTPVSTSNDTTIATTAFVKSTAMSATLPAQAGNAGKFITTDGTTVSWGQVYPALTNTNRKVLASNGTSTVWTDPTTLDVVQGFSGSVNLVWDMASGGVADITLPGDRTMLAPLNMAVRTYTLIVRQDSTGNRKLTWSSTFKWPGKTPPVLSTEPNAVDVFLFLCDGTSMYGMISRGMG